VELQRAETEDRRPALRLVRATPAEVAEWERLQRQQKIDAIMDAAAFSAVIEALRDSGKPAVGHNLSLDLAFMLHSFVQPLPPTWPEYKQLVQRQFPGGVYDTKLIASSTLDDYPDTSLGNLYAALQQRSAGGGPAGDGLPGIEHAQGYARYKGVQGGEFAHEAGFDAYMTGAVFGWQLHLYAGVKYISAADGTRGDAGMVVGTLRPSALPCWDVLQEIYSNKITAMRSDMQYLALKGPDCRPARPNVIYCTGFMPGALRRADIPRELGRCGVRGVRATLLGDGSSALVEFSEAGAVEDGIAALRDSWMGCNPQPFAAYRAVKEAARSGEGPQAAEMNGRPVKRPRTEKEMEVEAPAPGRRCSIM